MPVLILDPTLEKHFRATRDNPDVNRRDEVWEGVLVVPPQANNEHQRMVMRLCSAFGVVVDLDSGDSVLPGCNVSDRDKDWTSNYRDPDVAVYLKSNPAKDADTHWVGGPDLAVEIVSPGEDPRQKLDFYAKVKTREVLVIDRDPWAVELYRLRRGKMALVGKSDAANPATLASSALPLTFRLRPAKPRPAVVVSHADDKRAWTV
ncbi:MAG TPA: Uma2 family endonuclease [Gemmata sp.]|jgi:Uma2 family endonuclease|nr:Uma2 family endonuclease [Gemmata sp.]